MAPLSSAEQLSGVALGPGQQELLENLPIVEQQTIYADLGNKNLNIYHQKDEIIRAWNSKQVVLIVAPTGTGKTTQAPQWALEDGFSKIDATQPRRRPAQNAAERIESELSESLGGEDHVNGLVSYQTGGGLVGEYDAKIKVVTEGLLRIREAHQPSAGDNEIWILDEWHEQTGQQFLLAGMAKEKLANNLDFTVVVMTATPNLAEQIDFWTNENGEEPAVVVLKGETMHDIEHRIEPESTDLEETVKMAIEIFNNPDDHDGSNTIQVFVRGKREIKDVMDGIRTRLPAHILAKTTILKNHAKMTPNAQKPVYEDFEGIKIVVQTNIGKTSMTIPRTRCVITGGLERHIEIDDEGIPALVEVESSQDDMNQMKGRGGRTNSSIFIETKCVGRTFVPMNERPVHQKPEITRTEIDYAVLFLASIGKNIQDFEGSEIIPEISMARAIRRNQVLGAIDESGKITKLGLKMAKYPCSPERARSLVEVESRNSEQVKLQMAAIIAANEVGGLKLYEQDSTKNWEELSDELSSDSFAQLDIFVAIQGKKPRDLEDLDIDTNNYIRAEELYRKIAKRMNIKNIPKLKAPNVAQREILRRCLAIGYANTVYLPKGDGLFQVIGQTLRLREISNRSVVKSSHNVIVGKPRNIDIQRDGETIRKHIIEDVTEIPKDVLKDLPHSSWVDKDFTLRGGKYKQVQNQVFGEMILGSREVAAEPSPLLRAAVIERVKSEPGPSLRALYKIKKDLERLAHKAKYPIPSFTEDIINKYIEEATPDTVIDPSLVEENLRQRVADEKLTLASFVSPEQQDKIHSDAPLGIVVGGYTVKLGYSNGKATAKRFSIPMLNALGDELQLPDGRTVFFIHEEKRFTLLQLKRKLYKEGLL